MSKSKFNEYFADPSEPGPLPDNRHLESTDAEHAALACILMDPLSAETNLPKIPVYYFADLRHVDIRWGLEQLILDAKPPDVILLCQVLRNHDKLERAGGPSYISKMLDGAATSENFSHYMNVLARKANARLLHKLGDQIKTIATSGQLDKSSVEDARYMVDQLLDRANPELRTKLTLRRPSEILAMTFDDRDSILGDRLFCKGQQIVFAGQGGIGKSRIIFQMIAAIVAQRKCLAWETGNPDLKWLILQTENTNRRVQDDLKRVKGWLTEPELEIFDQRVLIHTLENDSDGFVSLDLPENRAAVMDAVEESGADIVVLDPLNDFGIGDLNKDADMKFTLQTAAKTIRKGNHERAIALSHHAITGKAGAAKAVGYDRSSFARNSKALLAWTRAQINIAAVDDDNNERIIIACGKCSNAREFSPFAAKLNPETMIYECDNTVDIKAWQDGMAGKEAPLATPEDAKRLCKLLMPRAELAARIQQIGVSRPTAYRIINRAVRQKFVSIDKNTELCSPL